MDLNRRTFLKFVGVGAVAGKLDFSQPRLEAETEFVDNTVDKFDTIALFVTVWKPMRSGFVTLYLDRGGDPLNAQILAMCVCDPKHERTVYSFDSGQVGMLGPRWRIIAKSQAEDDPQLGIGGELELAHVGQRHRQEIVREAFLRGGKYGVPYREVQIVTEAMHGIVAYLESCRRRRVTRVVELEFERWDGQCWRPQGSSPWHWHRARITLQLWPCRHRMTLRLRHGEFPTRAMAREPNKTGAWTGRDVPCTVCGPAERAEDRFDAPKARKPGDFAWRMRELRRRRRRTGCHASQLPDAPPQVQAFEAEQRYQAEVIRPLADAYDS
jgi:hypothetical protein